MSSYRYEFEELRLIKNMDVYAFGFAELSYSFEPGDAYTGYRGGIEWYVDSITIYSTSPKAGNLDLPKDHPLYDLIFEALREEEYRIIEKLEDDYNSDFNDEDG